MADRILFNKKVYHIKEDDLPCLVSYKEKTGGSHFSIAMIADLSISGVKILFFTAYPMAKDNFLEQVKGSELKIDYITSENQLDTTAQAIIVESGNQELFLQVVEKLDDISERVVFVKNIEVMGDAVVNTCLKLQKVIFSGDLDRCILKKEIGDKKFKTTIMFNESDVILPVKPLILEKYTGYLWSDHQKGLVRVDGR